jgi:hypothetical protein
LVLARGPAGKDSIAVAALLAEPGWRLAVRPLRDRI